jgi:hypothetical protein
MGGGGLVSATKFLVLTLSALYFLAGIVGFVAIEFDTTVSRGLWLGFLLAGAVLLLVGQLALPPSGRSALLVSLGAIVGGLPLFWTLIVPIAVAAVIACSVALSRRAAPAG